MAATMADCMNMIAPSRTCAVMIKLIDSSHPARLKIIAFTRSAQEPPHKIYQ